MPYYVTIQFDGGIRSDCKRVYPKSRKMVDILTAAVRMAAAHGGTATLVSNGRGRRIANLELPGHRKLAHRLLYLGGVPEEVLDESRTLS